MATGETEAIGGVDEQAEAESCFVQKETSTAMAKHDACFAAAAGRREGRAVNEAA